MALPIKETPILIGKDARNFDKWLEENKNKKASPEVHQRIKKSAAKFNLDK